MHNTELLSSLRPGECARIQSLNSEEHMRRRLLDIGFTGNTAIECLFRAAAGDPTAYLIRGTVIALRSDEADKIHVLRC